MSSTHEDNDISPKKVCFSESETRSLIAAIKKHPELWNSCEKNVNVRRKSWQEVFDEVNIEGMQMANLKSKWHTLRSQFVAISKAMNSEVLGHGGELSHKVNWQYYEDLLFLYDVDDAETQPKSDSDSQLPDQMEEEDEALNADDYVHSDVTLMLLEPQVEIVADAFAAGNSVSQSFIQFGNDLCQHDNAENIVEQPLPDTTLMNLFGNLPTSTPRIAKHHDNKTAAPLSNQNVNSLFCNYLLSELCTIPQENALRLRQLLLKDIHGFMGTLE